MNPRTLTPLRVCAALVALAPFTWASPKAPPLAHVQTDKALYRLGETVWYRVHLAPKNQAAFPLSVQLFGPAGAVLGDRTLRVADAPSGSFLIGPKQSGGEYRLEVRSGKQLLHRVPLRVYDAVLPRLKLSLTVLGEVHYPGKTVTATCRVRDLKGRPIAGVRVEARGTFGPFTVKTRTEPTDAEGRAVVRIELPQGVRRSGHLAVGVQHKQRMGAVAQPVHVSASVARVDVFPEGGAILPGSKKAPREHRLALLVRDLNGDPVGCDGRVFDDQKKCVGLFRADRFGHAMVSVAYVASRSYHVKIDRPAGVTKRFPLPGATGHGYALRLERDAGGRLVAHVAGKNKARTRLVLARGDGAQVHDQILGPNGKVVLVRQRYLQVAYVLLVRKQKVLLKAPVVVGTAWPFEVKVTPVENSVLLPGRKVTLQIETRFQGKPVSSDVALSVFNAGARQPARFGVSPLAARAFLQPHLKEIVHDASELFGRDAATRERLQAYVMTRACYRLPRGGVVAKASEVARDTENHRLLPGVVPPRPPAKQGRAKTAQRATALERLMARAHFTRHALPRPHGARTFARLVSRKKRLETPGLGKQARRPPQRTKPSRSTVDNRDTRFWQARVVTDAKGEARAVFRIGQEATPLVAMAQGFAPHGAAATGEVELAVKPLFESSFEMAEHVRVGDRLELWVTVKARDGKQTPYRVALHGAGCLKPLGRTQVKVDPRRSSARNKFLFQVVAPSERSTLEVVVTRGAYRETTTKTFTSSWPQLEIGYSQSGMFEGTASFTFQLPRAAVAGSLVARSSVSPTTPSTAAESLERLLRQPTGCFEQTTSSNYPNLTILSSLLQSGRDGGLLERAYALARSGFSRLKTFQHKDGGFSLWGQRSKTDQAHVRYTAMAVMQLAEYARLFQGKGTFELQQALNWLDHQTNLSPWHAVYAALATNEAGVPWSGRRKAAGFKPKTAYERALLANCLASWKGDWPGNKPRQALLERLADRLTRVQKPETGEVESKGHGVMGSAGKQLTVVTTALAAVAFHALGWKEAAERAKRYLASAKHPQGGWGGTQATALAIRALTRLERIRLAKPAPVEFRPGNGAVLRTFVGGGRDRPASFAKRLRDARPGANVSLSVSARTAHAVQYNLSCTFRVAKPVTNAAAPYRLKVDMPGILRAGSPEQVRVAVTRVGKSPQGQVTTQVGIPAGATLVPGSIVSGKNGLGAVEVKRGQVILYWSGDPCAGRNNTRVVSFEIVAKAPGHFSTGPSVVYPYYTSNREAYAVGKVVKVLNAYSLEGAAKLKGLGGARQARPPVAPGTGGR